ncbi:hypothetical protein NKR23_g7676 [Pleurostoma richardsiae]|uniref:Malate dehydrogenase n=1 Tax=Pleurostoma richardsiae TaxID=41990 RepID=A0AA38RMA1_9PEZI|nr:hypothetical protein NKR23_g7676 [Pleurostoma richardsiae]
MLSKTLFLLTSFAGAATAAPPCRPRSSEVSSAVPTSTVAGSAPTPTLPSTGATDLAGPPAGLVLKKIAVGHGIQNYTCANSSASTTATGALAVLYDITTLYPGTAATGLSEFAWAGLPSTVLWSQDLPLNLNNSTAAAPGTPDSPNDLPETAYGATSDPFPSPADLVLGEIAPAAFLGHHFFDTAGTPNFDLASTSGLYFIGAKTGSVSAPPTADAGVLGTGAVAWLQLTDNGSGRSQGLSYVYRVLTAGGNPHTCADAGAGAGSVPYAAMYWFYGSSS